MPKVHKDERTKRLYHFTETTLEKENKQLKEAIAELQDQEKQRDKNYKPKYDFAKPK